MVPYDFKNPVDRIILRKMWVYQPPLTDEYPITGISDVNVIINGHYDVSNILVLHTVYINL